MALPEEEFVEFRESVNKRFVSLEHKLTENTIITKNIDTKTAEVVEAFGAAKGAFKVLEFIGKLAKPLIWITGLGTALAVNATALKAHIATALGHLFK